MHELLSLVVIGVSDPVVTIAADEKHIAELFSYSADSQLELCLKEDGVSELSTGEGEGPNISEEVILLMLHLDLEGTVGLVGFEFRNQQGNLAETVQKVQNPESGSGPKYSYRFHFTQGKTAHEQKPEQTGGMEWLDMLLGTKEDDNEDLTTMHMNPSVGLAKEWLEEEWLEEEWLSL
ncbi:hypothetical protein GNI_073860 [Gregarina niphandrodes]|uniref:Uncharacterized protein n=1 Tax=Gregarina niphandrodes TaxID=110365 RepID=A0A023B722_GRENI|nr:hypothetical protein GNI_073860 [Gregarina niphandrodes]EZG66930.1 hypothetical protein GNI_073860 [Gregarina niphandrodes]|eukprot:XP_011130420.1 hypothetical protein GNI_073860 [Gregarina niphandrodes]